MKNLAIMSSKEPTTAWVRAGLVALPLYGLVLAYATRDPQPDQTTDPDGLAQFVSTTSYLVEHIASSVVGAVLVIFGTFALGAFLSGSRASRSALWGTVLAVTGQILFMVPGTISTFATPAIGAAYLSGNRDVMAVELSPVLPVITGVALLMVVAGNIVLGVAVWRSGVLPKWAGLIWIAATLIFYVLGAALGMATTGASLPTQPVGAVLMAISSGWIAWAVLRSRTAPGQANLPADQSTDRTSHSSSGV
jgi:hypothetical protein